MNNRNVRWELAKLIEERTAILMVGREVDYTTRERIKKLQDFLDIENEKNDSIMETETKTDLGDLPF